LLATLAWPLVRGKLTFTQLRERIGWTSLNGQGVGRRGFSGCVREAAYGLFAYFAFLPVLAVVLVITLLLNAIANAPRAGAGAVEEPVLPSNPVVDLVLAATPLQLALFFVLATCWAPIVEEAIFRGCLYRHMRGRLHAALCAAATALLFGVMHGYHWLMLGPVISLGVVFALMREWRGSIIGPMFAHFLHNATLTSLLIIMLPALKD
jgi:membrane protease YdiL (CAAX protease family)